jgi:hypothetical protein
MSSSKKSVNSTIKLSNGKQPFVSMKKHPEDDEHYPIIPEQQTIITIITVIYNLFIIYYLYKLEDVSCKCIIDWRHNYIKLFCIIMIIISVINYILKFNVSEKFTKTFEIIIFLFGCINTYCLFTYVGDLDSTKCTCSVEKQYNMHYFLYVWRWILIIIYIIFTRYLYRNYLSFKQKKFLKIFDR